MMQVQDPQCMHRCLKGLSQRPGQHHQAGPGLTGRGSQHLLRLQSRRKNHAARFLQAPRAVVLFPGSSFGL